MFKGMKKRKKSGFTLVELVVVIAVLMVISVLGVTAYGNITDSARLAALKTDAGQLSTALNNHDAIANTKYTGWVGANAAPFTTVATGKFDFSVTSSSGAADLPITVSMSPDNANRCVYGQKTAGTASNDKGAVIYANGRWDVASDTDLAAIAKK